MATFNIKEFFHFGFDEGIEKVDWKVSIENVDDGVIIRETVINTDPNHLDILNLDCDMKVQTNPYDPGMDMDAVNDGLGVYWRGDRKIWVSARITMSDRVGGWKTKIWDPELPGADGFIRHISNPLNLEEISTNISNFPDIIKVGYVPLDSMTQGILD